jgi:thiol-disulfide isomerase/thioredoxin
MKYILILLLIILTTATKAQPPMETMLVGRNNFSALKGNADFVWFDEGVVKYNPKAEYVDSLKSIKAKYSIVIVGGTWCSDTQDLLPKFYATAKAYGKDIDTETMLYFTDREKQAPADIVSKYGVTNVPVFIVLDKDDKEVGRITESVKVSIEADLLQILKNLK